MLAPDITFADAMLTPAVAGGVAGAAAAGAGRDAARGGAPAAAQQRLRQLSDLRVLQRGSAQQSSS